MGKPDNTKPPRLTLPKTKEDVDQLCKRAETSEWKEVRQGYWERKVTLDGVDFLETRYICQDCSDVIRRSNEVMVTNDLWDFAVPEDGFVCQKCLEERLNRKLVLEDLKDCPLNEPYREGFLMAVRMLVKGGLIERLLPIDKEADAEIDRIIEKKFEALDENPIDTREDD